VKLVELGLVGMGAGLRRNPISHLLQPRWGRRGSLPFLPFGFYYQEVRNHGLPTPGGGTDL
jgi:hypothetical protein